MARDRLASYQAHHDLLTGLPNRGLFNDRLQVAIAGAQRNRSQLALMFVDLDGFKAVNDELGHGEGDRLLQAVARRLRACVRRSDTLARFGGDEFALLVPDLRASDDAALLAGKMLAGLREPFALAGRRLSIGASIGIALCPGDGSAGETLIRKADAAMYHVKGEGKQGYRFYSQEMKFGHTDRVVTDRELHGGLIRGELDIFFLPWVSLESGRARTVEATWRWRRPGKGLVEPAAVVPAPGSGGPVAQVDNFLRKRAFSQTVAWHRTGHDALRLALDLPAARLAEPDFIEHFADNLHAAGLHAKHVTIQLDEQALNRMAEVIGPRLQELRARGIRVVAADFGAGLSSFPYLERLAVDGLKLSPALLRALLPSFHNAGHNPQEATGRRAIAAIAAAARELDLELIAGGVETQAQLALLQPLGFAEAEGPVFATAMPAADIERLIGANSFASPVGV